MTGFKDVVGRKDLVSYIQKAVTQKQISHAYIFKWGARIREKRCLHNYLR